MVSTGGGGGQGKEGDQPVLLIAGDQEIQGAQHKVNLWGGFKVLLGDFDGDDG